VGAARPMTRLTLSPKFSRLRRKRPTTGSLGAAQQRPQRLATATTTSVQQVTQTSKAPRDWRLGSSLFAGGANVVSGPMTAGV
jgi:hypothetical protein